MQVVRVVLDGAEALGEVVDRVPWVGRAVGETWADGGGLLDDVHVQRPGRGAEEVDSGDDGGCAAADHGDARRAGFGVGGEQVHGVTLANKCRKTDSTRPS